MIAYLEGKLLQKTGHSVLVATRGGVGYEVFVPLSLPLPASGEDICLYTALVVREDAQELFGFASFEERETFKMLITINRVGARTALAILSVYKPDDLRRIVAQEDENALTKVSGIGKQTGQKIFLELKYKFKADGSLNHSVCLPAAADASVFADALTGLLNLGYDNQSAGEVLREVLQKEPDLGVGEALRAALKLMAKKK